MYDYIKWLAFVARTMYLTALVEDEKREFPSKVIYFLKISGGEEKREEIEAGSQ